MAPSDRVSCRCSGRFFTIRLRLSSKRYLNPCLFLAYVAQAKKAEPQLTDTCDCIDPNDVMREMAAA